MRRDFVKYTGDQYQELYAHKVTEETRGEVARVGGPGTTPDVGDYIVQSTNTNMYDVYSPADFDDMGLTPERDQIDYTDKYNGKATVDSDEDDYFEPSDHTAAEVRAYLSREDVSDENKIRVEHSEVNDKNRQTAFPKEYVRTV